MAREQIVKMLTKSGSAPQEVTVGDGKFWQSGSAYFGIYNSYLLGSSSKEGLEALLASFTGKAPNLTTNPQFQAMRKKFNTDQGGIGFVDLTGLADTLPLMAGSDFDDKTQDALKGLKYGAFSVTYKDSQMDGGGFLALDAQSQSAFIKTMLTSPNQAMRSAEVFPAEWSNYSSLNVHYLLNVVLEGLKLSPKMRKQVDDGLAQVEKGSGLSIEKDIWGAFSGEVAWSSDAFKNMPAMFQANFSRARQQGQTTACKSNLKNIGTSLEMYSTDNAGRYPKSLDKLAPNYLKAMLICPSAGSDTYSKSFVSAVDPDAYTVICQGKYHGAENFPQYTSYEGLNAGDARDAAATAPAAAEQPTYIIAIGLKDPAKADALLAKLDALAPAKATDKVGEVQLYEYSVGAVKAMRCTLSKPVPFMLVAVGPQAQAMLTDAIQVKSAVAAVPVYQAVSKNQSEQWVSGSYLDLGPLIKALRPMLGEVPELKDNVATLDQFVDSIKDMSSASYVAVEPDGVRLVSQGTGSVAIGGLATLTAILVPNFIRARAQGQTTACKSNLKNLGTALEMYSTDNAGRYPTSLGPLTPNYLKRMPICPSANSDTYSSSYQFAANPDAYSFFCQGLHHGEAGLKENFPQYNSYYGLVLEK